MRSVGQNPVSVSARLSLPRPPIRQRSKVEVLDIFDKMKVVGPRACFSDRGLSHRTFDQVIDTKFGSVVGPRS